METRADRINGTIHLQMSYALFVVKMVYHILPFTFTLNVIHHLPLLSHPRDPFNAPADTLLS